MLCSLSFQPAANVQRVLAICGVLLIVLVVTGKADVPGGVPQGGFEAGLAAPWGTGQYSQNRPVWWTRGPCQVEVTADRTIVREGAQSLRIVNRSRRAPQVYGTTQQPLTLIPNQKYRLSVWARANGLASPGAVSLVVDPEWKIRPIQLPSGTYDWTRFTGEFSLPHANGQIRILSEDRGEVWLDQIELTPVSTENPPSSPPLAARVVRPSIDSRITHEVSLFRKNMARDANLAVERCGTRDVQRRFRELNGVIWPDTDPRVGWSYFISLSLPVVGGPHPQQSAIAFYNPWCDLFLVTIWKADDDRVQLVDLELLMGDWLRSGNRFPEEPKPAWLNNALYKPTALGLVTAESILAFETRFVDVDALRWRNVVLRMDDPQVLRDWNDTGAALLLWDGVTRLHDFRSPQPEESPLLKPLRSQTQRILQAATSGQLAGILTDARQTPAEVRTILQNTPARELAGFTPVSYLLDGEHVLVFLVDDKAPDRCLSLQFRSADGELHLNRLDLILHAAFYHMRKQADQP